METVIARNALRETIGDMSDAAQSLAIRPGVQPAVDAEGSEVAYDKGAWFLSFLEQRFGRTEFDAFLREYFDHFAFQGIDSKTFIEYAEEKLLAKYPGKVTVAELEQWLYEPGIPESAPEITSPRLDAVDTARKAWLDGGDLPATSVTDAWTTQEWVHFVEGLPETLSSEQLAALDKAYAFTGTANGEVAQRWYPLAVRSGYDEANEAIAAFLKRVGRRKLIMPTYDALVATPEGLALAEQVMAEARPGYHPITTASVDAVIAKAKGDDTVAKPAD